MNTHLTARLCRLLAGNHEVGSFQREQVPIGASFSARIGNLRGEILEEVSVWEVNDS